MRTALHPVALAATLAAGPLAAQAPAALPRPSLWIGAGAAVPLAEPGVARTTGTAALLGLEVPVVTHLTVRVELSGSLQDVRTRAGGPLTGDHQHLRTIAAARFAPLTVGRVAPYVLAGGGAFWQSDRVVLRDVDDPVPDAEYRQTTSRAARGALLGAGLGATVAGAHLFAEARWTRVGARVGPTTDLGVVAGVRAPFAR